MHEKLRGTHHRGPVDPRLSLDPTARSGETKPGSQLHGKAALVNGGHLLERESEIRRRQQRGDARHVLVLAREFLTLDERHVTHETAVVQQHPAGAQQEETEVERQEAERRGAMPHAPDRLRTGAAHAVAEAHQGRHGVIHRPVRRQRGGETLLHPGPGAQPGLLSRFDLDPPEDRTDPPADHDGQVQEEQGEHRKEHRARRHAAHAERDQQEPVHRSGSLHPRVELLLAEDVRLWQRHVEQEQEGEQHEQGDGRLQRREKAER